jgi:hypothetical protein
MTAAANDAQIRLTNGIVDVVVATGFGPRVLRYGFVGGDNIFGLAPGGPIETALGPWQPAGGHRLWVAPESMPGSYAPDRFPVSCELEDASSCTFRQETDDAGIEKQLRIVVAPSGTLVIATHTITNRTYWPIQVAPWAITAVTPLGTALIPQPPYRSHDVDLLPACPLVEWSFTDLTDPRWSIGRKLVRLSADARSREPQKIGVGNAQGWCAVLAGDHAFIKRFPWRRGERYPDYGCNNELYTAAAYLEVETLGPLRVLAPGASSTHVEHWYLFRGVTVTAEEEEQHALLQALLSHTADVDLAAATGEVPPAVTDQGA